MGSEYDEYEEELVANTAEQRNWRGIAIALLVIVTVLSLIVTAILLVTPKEVEEHFGERLTLKDYIDNNYEPRQFKPVWRSDDAFIYTDAEGAVIQYDCSDNSTTTVMDNSTFRELNTDRFKISADGKYVLLTYDINYIYRYSHVAKYKIYNVATRIHLDLFGPKIEENEGENMFQYVTWSPVGHSLVVVLQNNIYFVKDIEHPIYQQITNDGQKDAIYNGIPDWLYEEEILHSENSIWWFEDGSRIIYAKINDTTVRRYDMTMYGPPKHNYVENRRIPYPKAGTTNPSVNLYVYHLEKNLTSMLHPPAQLQIKDHYLISVTMYSRDHVLITWMNRAHNVSILSVCDLNTTKCKDSYRTVAATGWLEMSDAGLYTSSDGSYFLILPRKAGQLGNFKHIAKVETKVEREGASITFLTTGPLEVKEIVGYDDEQKIIYFLGVHSKDPRERHLYSVSSKTDLLDYPKVNCLSCDFSKDCLFVEAVFSPSGKYYVLSCNGPGIPYHQLMKTPNIFVRMLDDNEDFREFMNGKSLPLVEYLQITTTDGGVLWTKLLFPPELKKNEILKYNLLFKVYGSPGTQLVTHEYSIGWEHYQCSHHNRIIAFVDGRGSGGRGDNWLNAVFKRFGTVEIDDIITVANYVKRLQYVDEKIAIWGVSHGGFLTSSVIANKSNPFPCGVAIAPVTDWRYYDTFYTERYMGLPTVEDNLNGYVMASVLQNAINFKKSKFMLVHGTGDDNVHFQHSAQLMKVLTAQDVYYKSLIYTDQQHWLNIGNTRKHMFKSIEDFLDICFGKTSPENDITEQDENEEDEDD